MRLASATALLVCQLSVGAASAATTVTATDVTTARGSVRISHFRPDAPLASLIVLTGGDGILGLNSNGLGLTDQFLYSAPIRNRDRFLERGYAVILVEAPSDMLTGEGLTREHRASPAHLAELLEVVRVVRQRDNVPTWVIGFSAGGGSAANLAINAPRSTPFGLILLSPNTANVGAILGMNLEALQRPTLLLTHQNDTCAGTPPTNAPTVMSRLSATPARRHVEFTGGDPGSRGGGCDSTGHHGLGGLDIEFVTEVVDWMRVNASLVQAANFQGLWWRSPAGSESGWGVNLTHQGETLFATWFTYDVDGRGMWLVMSAGAKVADNTYSGALYRTSGPAFSATPFDSSQVSVTQVGTATFTFTDSNEGTFAYVVNAVSHSKPITRQVFSTPVPACIAGGASGPEPNYQALWWSSPAGAESGWGVNITHQGDILFATWFTYATDGRGMWLVMSNGAKTASGTYSGALYRTTGPAFSANPWSGSSVTATQVGTGTFAFSDANNGSFTYTLDGVSQSKAITRQVYATPTTVCR